MTSGMSIWSKSEFGISGNHQEVAEKLTDWAFSTQVPRVEMVSMFHGHICFSNPEHDIHFAIRYIKQEDVMTERWNLTRPEYDRLVEMRNKRKKDWEEYKKKTRIERDLKLREVDPEAMELCKKVLKRCASKIKHLRFMDMSFTEPKHQELFNDFFSSDSDFAPSGLHLPMNSEFDHWLGNFIYERETFLFPNAFMKPHLRTIKDVFGVSRHTLSLFWEPIELDYCSIHFTGFWAHIHLSKLKAKVKMLVVENADEFFVNVPMITHMKVNEFALNFANRHVIRKDNDFPPFKVREFTMNEHITRLTDFDDYLQYIEYLSLPTQQIKILTFNMEVRFIYSEEFAVEFNEKFLKLQETMVKFDPETTVNLNLFFELTCPPDDEGPVIMCEMFKNQGEKSFFAKNSNEDYEYRYNEHDNSFLHVKLFLTPDALL
ncbi:hypothetical protein M3Y97_01024000 [Aphelenchoides bicaudatus]|nr:hypothetical protein M3Y97_01024000 [Aphelenchoides bicaudatus]